MVKDHSDSEKGYPQWSNGFTMKDQSDDQSHYERMLLPQSYISLPQKNE